MKTAKSKNITRQALREALMWLEGQEHLYGLTPSGVKKYRKTVSLIKQALSEVA